MLTLDERKSIAKSVPWVQFQEKPKQCEVKVKKDRYCKKGAQWTYTYLKKSGMYKRNLCWLHLFFHGFYLMFEQERLNKWLRKHHPYLFKDLDGI